jgi:cytochrome c oxidase subunit 2
VNGFRLALVVTSVVVALAACGDDGGGGDALPSSDELGLSAEAIEGRALVNSSGCAGCHGPDGSGGAAPALVGLIGRERAFTDAEPLVADADYVRESIRDPGAKHVDGYSLQMPGNSLSDDEIDRIITYLDELEPRP